jgi:hypothetical protein
MLIVSGVDWSGLEHRLKTAIGKLTEAVQGRDPRIHCTLQRSTNDMKPVDLVATFALPGQEDHQLVLSLMFTRFRGTWEAHCDVMREDGPVLSEIPVHDLGVRPTNAAVEAVAREIETFILNADEVIVRALVS